MPCCTPEMMAAANSTEIARRRFLTALMKSVVCVSAGNVDAFTSVLLSAEQPKVQRGPWRENRGELLYNGIRLPATWPPVHLRPESMEPMPVPYLDNPPDVIPIDVGRQLFLDDFLIESTNLRRTYHAAKRYEGNPVLTSTVEGESNRDGVLWLGHGGLFFDPQVQLFKMFYRDGRRGPLALATSRDLLHWTRPELSSGRGNVLLARVVDDNSIWLDLDASRPDERLKYLEAHRGPHHPLRADNPDLPALGHFLYTSADGLKWSEAVPVGRWRGDFSSFFHNPFRRVWVFSIRTSHQPDASSPADPRGRIRLYFEHADFLKANWNNAVYWTGADRLDEPEPEGSYHQAAHAHGCQLYSLNAVAYESLMVGLHYIHRGPDNSICAKGGFPKLIDLELGFSRDGFHWHRPVRKPFLAGTRQDGDWDRAYLHGTTGVFATFGDKLVFPYTGFSGMAPDGRRGMYNGASIGLAYIRRDGFASMEAGSKGGTLTTRRVTFSGRHLFVNADVPHGNLRAEVLDERGRPIAPFTLANSIPFSGDSTLEPISWKGGSDLATLRGRPVRLRFELTDGSLYAFWVSRDITGRSDGYVGAGGPGYDGVIDTIGRTASFGGER